MHYFDPHAEYLHHPGTEEFGRKVRDMYDHEVRWTDDQMKRVLDFVESPPRETFYRGQRELTPARTR